MPPGRTLNARGSAPAADPPPRARRAAKPAAAPATPPQPGGRRAVATAAAVKWAGGDDTQKMLQRWQNEVPHDRLAHLVKHTIRALDRALQMRLAQHEVAIGHWVFLRALWEGDGITQRALSREAGMMEPTTFAALKAMEKRGYIVRRQLADNRRNVHVFLTPKGRALERKLVPLALECNAIAVRGVPVQEVAITRSTLLSMLRNLAQEETASAGDTRRIASTRERGRLVDAAQAPQSPQPRRTGKPR